VTSIDPLREYAGLSFAFGDVVARVEDHQWGGPTPCAEWNVCQLVNHLVSETMWIPPLMGGATVSEVGGRFDGDVLGEDPRRAWARAAADAVRAVAEVDRDRIVHVTGRDVSAAEYAGELVADLFLHRWDLAKAIGADAALDPDLAERFYQEMLPFEAVLRSSGLFGEHVDVPDDADAPTRLLALAGRRADWSPPEGSPGAHGALTKESATPSPRSPDA
jgi:uncharacterized protein (TIGR03086 family)